MGALVAFELSRWLQREHGLKPVPLFVSGCGAPQAPRGRTAVHELPADQFKQELRRLNGTPAAALDNDELMDLVLPSLRADFSLCETYEYAAGPPLSCPIIAVGGLGDDTVGRQELDAWREQTTGPFRVRMLPGDHFFLHGAQALLTQALARDLQEARQGPASLGEGDAHVWRVRLDQPERQRAGLRGLLSADEEARAGRFHFPKDRERFVACRGALRLLLGRYLSLTPEQLRFQYGASGKPALAGEGGRTGLRFNVAHSEGWALIAVTRGREVGVDLERLRGEVATQEIAARYFSPRECESLQALPGSLRAEAFFRCWTRKEAYLKATGAGLGAALGRFAVTLDPAAPAALLEHRDEPDEVSRWSLRELPAVPGFAAALAVENPLRTLWCGEWVLTDSAERATRWARPSAAGSLLALPRREDRL
jgi:4'-phosphopantetheinyl transferase